MKAVGLSVANIAKSIVDSMPQKMSKPTATDVEKISAGLSHSDNVATRDLDSASVNAYIATAIALDPKIIDMHSATVESYLSICDVERTRNML